MADDTTLTQAIEAFLRRRVLPGGKRKYNQALGFFDQSEQASRQTYGLKQQPVLAAWINQVVSGPQAQALAEALSQVIGDSIAAYTRPKQPLFDLYRSFCKFLEEAYQLSVPIEWDAYNIHSNHREWQIIQMSTENKTIQEMAERLMVSDRQIREDMNKLADDGLTFLDRKIKISGLERTRGDIQFESTPHPILLLGNLMQVINVLEALRHDHQISHSYLPIITARQIWQNLSAYAKTTIKKRIRDGVYASDLDWYKDLELTPVDREPDTFLTESEIVTGNVQDQLLKCLKNGENCTVRYRDQEGSEQVLNAVRISGFSGGTVQLEILKTGQTKTIAILQATSCEQEEK